MENKVSSLLVSSRNEGAMDLVSALLLILSFLCLTPRSDIFLGAAARRVVFL